LADRVFTGPCDYRLGGFQSVGEASKLRFGNGASVETAFVDDHVELAGLLVGGGAKTEGVVQDVTGGVPVAGGMVGQSNGDLFDGRVAVEQRVEKAEAEPGAEYHESVLGGA
jgi:hypothetical protein